MAERFLIDTGFAVALSIERDREHRRCREAWAAVRGEFHSTEGVLVESAWLVRAFRGGAEKVFGLLNAAGTHWAAPTASRLERAIALAEHYRNVPMDFVDATLVALAEERDIENVLTLDRRGFEVYRLGRNRRFKILP